MRLLVQGTDGMTFQEFQTLCNGVVASNISAAQPCPIVIGVESAVTLGSYGEGFPTKELVILKEQVPQAEMLAILRSCRFTYDAANNQTVIQPVTTVTG